MPTNRELTLLHDEMRACTRCLDDGYAVETGAVFSGGTKPQVMLIGQAPGITEVEAKRPFNASSGRRLFQWLGDAGFDEATFRATHYMTSVTKCYPGRTKSGKGDRVPSKVEQKLCRSFLEREMAMVNPKLIIAVGKLSIRQFYQRRVTLGEIVGTAVYFPPDTLTNPILFDTRKGVEVNAFDEERENGRYLVPLPHPSGASLWPNHPDNRALIARAIDLLNDIRVGWKL